MIELELHSEKYSATGNASSEGVKNQLGRPDMDVIEVLVRETVQNSWDARLPGKRTVQYDIAGWELDNSQRSVLDNNVFACYPDNVGWEQFENEPITVLAISDRNTSGLGGPTRADAVSDEETPRDFVDFIRNVGTPRDKHLGGGTYGFGKSSLYLASHVSTICVYTRCKTTRGLESRFIAATLGPSYKVSQGLGKGMYTGRHWWGSKAEDGIVEPVIGRSADALARGLGMPEFDDSETGTTLLVVLPRLDDITDEQIGRRFQSALLWSFWPKMLHGYRKSACIKFNISWKGKVVPVIQPQDVAPLASYVQAMENLKAFHNDEELPHEGKIIEIRSQRPAKLLGHLSLVKSIRNHAIKRLGDSEDACDGNGPNSKWGPEQRSHHVALMRIAELVVKYHEGPPLSTELLEYGGVFITNEEVDDAFARSEPPTHDDWKPDILDISSEKTLIRVAFREIKSALREFSSPITPGVPGTDQVSLGGVSGLLGGLVPTLESGGAGLVRRPGTKKKQPGKPGVRAGVALSVLNDGDLVLVEGGAAVRYEFSVTRASEDPDITVEVIPQVLINDGRSVEKDAPVGDQIPEVLYWESIRGGRQDGGNTLELGRDDPDEWSVVIGLPADALTGVSFAVWPESK